MKTCFAKGLEGWEVGKMFGFESRRTCATRSLEGWEAGRPRHIHALLAMFALLSVAFGQTPIEKAQEDLRSAKADLQRVQDENNGLRSALYREINLLDDEAITLAKELRKLERDEELRTSKAASLDRIIEARDAESKFVTGVLNDYISSFPARLTSAERQQYQEKVDAARREAAAAEGDLVAQTSAEISVVTLGLDRLEQVAGGHLMDGKGLRGGESLAGTFAVVGPAAYFAEEGGEFAGIAAFSEADVSQPRIIELTPEQTSAVKSLVSEGEGQLPFDGSMGKAIVVQASEETLAETAAKGGIVGYAILGLGAAAMLLALFKVVEINAFKVPSRRKINDILDDLLERRHDEAKAKAAQIRGLSGKLVQTGVENFYGKRRILEETLFEKLLAVRPKLDRFLPFLSLVAAAAPLMGLLGTVLGIIKTFKQMAIHGTGDAKSFSAGISEALITTAEGLVVAIPVLIVHGILRSMAKGKFAEIESIAVSLMNGTTELEDKKALPETPDAPEEPDEEDELLTPQPA